MKTAIVATKIQLKKILACKKNALELATEINEFCCLIHNGDKLSKSQVERMNRKLSGLLNNIIIYFDDVEDVLVQDR